MAILYLTNPTTSSFNWQVGTLSNLFNSDHYMEMILSTGTVANGSTTRPTGIMDTIIAPSNRNAHNTPVVSVRGSAGTTYRLYATARTTNGRYYNSGSATITLPSQTLTPAPTSVSASGSTSSELYIVWSRVATATQYRVRIDGTIRTVSGTSMYWGGLYSDTLYTVEVQAHNPSNDIPYSGWVSTTGRTLAPSRPDVPGNLTGVASSSTSIDVSWNRVAGADNYEIRITSPISRTYIEYGQNFTMAGLIPDTQYQFQIRAFDSSKDIPNSLWSGYRYTRTLKGRPPKWGWDRSIVAGGVFHITADEWNRFTNNINAVRAYRGLSVYAFNTVSSGQTFAAAHFNGAGYAISSMNPPVTPPPSVSSGDSVTAFLFNRIMNSLNSIE